jgi:SAM-dependent methyltransferase
MAFPSGRKRQVEKAIITGVKSLNYLERKLRRVLHALDFHGVRGIVLGIVSRVRGRRPVANSSNQETTHPFDQLLKTDTSGYTSGEYLGGSALTKISNTAYYAISPSTLTAAISQIPVELEIYTFVDLGCGKGRALLVAATFPFKRIVGIEISADLCRIAHSNTKMIDRVEVVNQDATSFSFPPTPQIIYLYHPFIALGLKRMLKNLKHQIGRMSTVTYVLYANPRYTEVIAKCSFLEKVWDQEFPLSLEDADADRHGIVNERFALYQLRADVTYPQKYPPFKSGVLS